MSRETYEFRVKGGFVSCRKRYELRDDELGPDSSEWLIDPVGEKLVRRGGSAPIQDTVGSLVGLLESSWGARAEFAGPLQSPSFSSAYEGPAVLFSDETDKEGTLGWIDINNLGAAAARQQLCKEFGSSNYSTASGTVVNMKIPPVWVENSTQKFHRYTSATQRKFATPGSRQWLDVGNWRHFPNALGTPLKWNKRFNKDTSTTSEVNRTVPWMAIPPLSLGFGALSGAAAGSGDNNWKDGDSFFFSILYEYEDGSLSAPFMPQPKGTTTASGTVTCAVLAASSSVDLRNGHVLVGTIGGGGEYKQITWSQLPRGPEGVTHKWLLRTPVTNLTATDSQMQNGPTELQVIARILNSATSYVDAGGSDGALTPDDRVQQAFDLIATPRAQYAVGADGRTVVGGNVQIHPAAIILAPVGISSGHDVAQLSDENASAFGSTQCFVQCTGSALVLRRAESGGSFPTASIGDDSITLTNKTLQEIVNDINERTAIQTGGGVSTHRSRWGAQLAPGVDGSLLATNLADMTGGSGHFGDDAMLTGGGNGNFRAFNNAYYGVLYFSHTYLATLKVDTQAVVMTQASPTVPGGNANSFTRDKAKGWKYPPDRSCGGLIGLAPITGQGGVVAVAVYEGARYVLRNSKGPNSGEDEDYRLMPINAADGGVSHRAISSGPGVYVVGSEQGIIVGDGSQEINISRGKIWDAKLKRGEFSYEMPKALAALPGGSQAHYFSLKFLGDKLAVTYRDQSLTYASRRIEYAFGEGVDALGLAGMLRQVPDGRPVPYGWSAPIKQHKISVMGQYRDATGTHNFGVDESNGGSTGDGNLVEFDVGTKDNAGGLGSAAGTAFSSYGYSRAVIHGYSVKGSAVQVIPLYNKNGDGLTLTVYVDQARGSSQVLTLPSTGSSLFSMPRLLVNTAMRAASDYLELLVTDDGTGSVAPEFNGCDVPVDLLKAM